MKALRRGTVTGFGLAILLPLTALAQDPTEDWGAWVVVEVPVTLTDLTDDVYAVEIVCWLFSSLLREDDQNIGLQRVIIASEDYIPENFMEPSEIETMFENSPVSTDVIHDRLQGFNDGVSLLIEANSDQSIFGWTHGSCNLNIFHDDLGVANANADAPVDCYQTPEVEPVALCKWPGSELISQVQFSRPGFDLEGQPIGDADTE